MCIMGLFDFLKGQNLVFVLMCGDGVVGDCGVFFLLCHLWHSIYSSFAAFFGQ